MGLCLQKILPITVGSPALAAGRCPLQLWWAGAGQIGPQWRSGAAVGQAALPEVWRHLGGSYGAMGPWMAMENGVTNMGDQIHDPKSPIFVV